MRTYVSSRRHSTTNRPVTSAILSASASHGCRRLSSLRARLSASEHGWHALFAAALVISMTCQSPSTDRSLAEQLARSGQTVEALAIFERIVAAESRRHRGPAVDREAATPHGTNGGSRGRIPRRPSRASLRRRRAHRSWRGTDEERRLEGSARRSCATRNRTRARTPTCSAPSPAPTGVPATIAAPSSTTSGPWRSRRVIRIWSTGTKPRCERMAHRSRSKASPREG